MDLCALVCWAPFFWMSILGCTEPSQAAWMDNTLIQLHKATVTDLKLSDCWVYSHISTTASGVLSLTGVPFNITKWVDFSSRDALFNKKTP